METYTFLRHTLKDLGIEARLVDGRDPQAFAQLLTRGVGRHRAFGSGLDARGLRREVGEDDGAGRRQRRRDGPAGAFRFDERRCRPRCAPPAYETRGSDGGSNSIAITSASSRPLAVG